jgi:hypothetical protein
MAWIFDGKHFGGYTYEHWFDDDTASDAGEDPDAQTKAATETPASAGEDSGGGSALQGDGDRRKPSV